MPEDTVFYCRTHMRLPCPFCNPAELPQSRAERMEEFDRRIDNVLAEANPKLPIYEPK